MTGAALLGVLDHASVRDLEQANVSSKNDLSVSGLIRVVKRGDHGLHGCGFEYAVHETLNGASALPERFRQTVTSVVSAEVGAIFQRHGAPVVSWGDGVRSVMFGLEEAHDPGRADVLAKMGPEPVLFIDGVAWRLAEHRPNARLPKRGPSPYPVAGRDRPEKWCRQLSNDLPDELGWLWKTDLFLGGAPVQAPVMPGHVTLQEATAWTTATLKYRHRQG